MGFRNSSSLIKLAAVDSILCYPNLQKYISCISYIIPRFGTCYGLCRGKRDLRGQYIQRKYILHKHYNSKDHTNFYFYLQAVEQFGNQRNKENELRVAKEKELQKVQVKKEDIELIVSNHKVHRV